MRGIGLTAGRGDRPRPITGNRPKCPATVGGCTILKRQLRALRACGDAGRHSASRDVVFHRQLLTDLVTARYEDALLVAFRGRSEQYLDEEMKLRVRNGHATEISKSLRDGEADGESIGIAKFGATGAGLLVDEMDRLVTASAIKDWAPSAPVLDDAVPTAGTAVRRAADHV